MKPIQPFEEWIKECAPLIAACAEMSRMVKLNKEYQKMGEGTLFDDTDLDVQRQKIEELRQR